MYNFSCPMVQNSLICYFNLPFISLHKRNRNHEIEIINNYSCERTRQTRETCSIANRNMTNDIGAVEI